MRRNRPNAPRDARIESLIHRQYRTVSRQPSSLGWQRIARLKRLISPQRIAVLEAARGLR